MSLLTAAANMNDLCFWCRFWHPDHRIICRPCRDALTAVADRHMNEVTP